MNEEEREDVLPEDDTPPWEPEEDPEEGLDGGEVIEAAPPREAAPDLRAHYEALRAQAESLRRENPDFDPDAALRDAAFVRLTAPAVGLTAAEAYAALHRGELDARAEQRGAESARRELARAVTGGTLRPREGGGLRAGALTRSDYRALSRPEQLALKQRIREAAARGEKIYP